jgi:ubiquinone/menaquinone biosynthesis C-methylase UbiE
MEIKNFFSTKHNKVVRNYLQRMREEKVKCMQVSKKYGYHYWDGDRKYGYGGYNYIPGYHTDLAKKIIKKYKLNNNSKILDVGCGKGFLAYEIKRIIKSEYIYGTDISTYAKKNALKDFKNNIKIHNLTNKFLYKNNYFDLVLCTNVLHNLRIEEIVLALQEINRISKKQFVCVESYRNEKEQFNLQCWALTAETLVDVKTWKWILKLSKFRGNYEFIYFR